MGGGFHPLMIFSGSAFLAWVYQGDLKFDHTQKVLSLVCLSLLFRENFLTDEM